MHVSAATILTLAKSFLGVQESPANSNNVRFNTDYYGKAVSGDDYPWCCAFVWDIFRLSGASELFYGGGKTAYTPEVKAYAEKHDQWVEDNYRPGDCALFNFKGGTTPKHIGFIEKKNSDGTYETIEGNTGVGNDANGGEVMRRTRQTKFILGAFRPNYGVETTAITHTSNVEEDEDMDFTKMTDEQVDTLLARIEKRQASQAIDDYAKVSGEKAVTTGLVSDGNKNGVIDNPQGYLKRQDMAVILDRAGLLRK